MHFQIGQLLGMPWRRRENLSWKCRCAAFQNPDVRLEPASFCRARSQRRVLLLPDKDADGLTCELLPITAKSGADQPFQPATFCSRH